MTPARAPSPGPRRAITGTLRLSKPAPPKVAAIVKAMKPPPPSPKELAVAAENQRAEWRKTDLALCRERFPALFDIEHPVPLAIHIHKPLGKVLGKKRALRLLEWWVAWPRYVAAVAAGGPRYNLDGSIAGEISEQHRGAALASLGYGPQPLDRAA